MEWVNPHSWILIDVKGADGTIVTWMVESGSPNALLQLGSNKSALPPGSEDSRRGMAPSGQWVKWSNSPTAASSFLADRRRELAVRSRISSSLWQQCLSVH